MAMEDLLREVHAWRVNRAWYKRVHGSVFLTVLDMCVCHQSYQGTPCCSCRVKQKLKCCHH